MTAPAARDYGKTKHRTTEATDTLLKNVLATATERMGLSTRLSMDRLLAAMALVADVHMDELVDRLREQQ